MQVGGLSLQCGTIGEVPAGVAVYLGRPFLYPIGSDIGRVIAGGGLWDPVLRRIVSHLLPEPDPTICEVGSNIGASLLQVLSVKPRAQVVAVEPSDRFRPFLERNLKLAGARNVEVVPLLAGSRPGSMVLHNIGTTASVVTTGFDPNTPPGKQVAEMTTLDDVLADRARVDFIKIDAGGFDFEVVRGAAATIRRAQPILYFELAAQLLTAPLADLEWLQTLGYGRLVCLNPWGGLVGVTDQPEQALDWSRAHSHCDVIACPEGSPAEARSKSIALPARTSPDGPTVVTPPPTALSTNGHEVDSAPPLSADEIKAEMAKHSWHHQIDLGGGIITPGTDPSAWKLSLLKMPDDLTGLSVLDIGTWNGFFAFEAERRGASRVLAVDSFVWTFEGSGARPAFEFARRALRSKVEDRHIDVLDLSPSSVGVHDLVLFLGVLYHMRHPLLALERVASVTPKQLILETHIELADLERPAMAFYPGSELNEDPSNWWAPNPAAVEEMLKTVGFKEVEKVSVASSPLVEHLGYYRMAFHAWK